MIEFCYFYERTRHFLRFEIPTPNADLLEKVFETAELVCKEQDIKDAALCRGKEILWTYNEGDE